MQEVDVPLKLFSQRFNNPEKLKTLTLREDLREYDQKWVHIFPHLTELRIERPYDMYG